jgi:hypothetical protein
MSNITELLQKLEGATILGREFIETKIDIQDELAKLTTITEPGTEMHQRIADLFMNWRRLGGSAGTLQGYSTAIKELKAALPALEDISTES